MPEPEIYEGNVQEAVSAMSESTLVRRRSIYEPVWCSTSCSRAFALLMPEADAFIQQHASSWSWSGLW